MKKTCERIIYFGAGRPFDAYDRATSFWTGMVAYQWDAKKQVFHVHTEQVLGTGTATNSSEYESEHSCEGVNDLLDYFKELEAHYKKVDGE